MVCQLFQQLSHTSRFYIVSSEGLPGFVVDFELLNWLKVLHETERMEDILGTHLPLEHFDVVLKDLGSFKSKIDREKYLETLRPGVFVAMLKASKRDEERRAWCYESHAFYTLYVKDYLVKDQVDL